MDEPEVWFKIKGHEFTKDEAAAIVAALAMGMWVSYSIYQLIGVI